MRLGKYVVCVSTVIALVAILFIGCGVNSGSRTGNDPYNPFTGPGPGLPGGPPAGGDPGDASAAEQEVFDIVNQERETAGVNPLSWDNGLYELAKAHSNDMCDRGFFSHVNPEGESPFDRAAAGHAGSYTFAPTTCRGENIAMGYSSATAVMEGWMNSPGHRANILNGGFTAIGVGVCDGCGRHWTQCFR